MKLLICGGRNFNDYSFLETALKSMSVTCIIQGGANGADALGKQYAQYNNLPCIEYKANWTKHGRSAGPIRNRQMLVEGKPDAVLALPGGRGTANMIKQALQMGLPVLNLTDSGL